MKRRDFLLGVAAAPVALSLPLPEDLEVFAQRIAAEPILPVAAGNTLCDLIPEFYHALDVISQELTGFIPHVNCKCVLAPESLQLIHCREVGD